MKSLISKDGTPIAYEELGKGPPLVLVDGAFCNRNFGPMPKLAPLLAERFTVVHYDRRGRNQSGDTAPYAVEREIEDLKAIVDALGGWSYVYGTSSGAVLALRAVAAGVRAKKLVLHEPPLILDGKHKPDPLDFREQIGALLASDRRSDAVKMFMKVVGVPSFVVAIMQFVPGGVWRTLKSVAHTLPYDFAVLGDTQSGGAMPAELVERAASIDVPTLVLVGTKSPAWMQHSVRSVASKIARAQERLLPGQDHNVAAKSVAPVLQEFFSA